MMDAAAPANGEQSYDVRLDAETAMLEHFSWPVLITRQRSSAGNLDLQPCQPREVSSGSRTVFAQFPRHARFPLDSDHMAPTVDITNNRHLCVLCARRKCPSDGNTANDEESSPHHAAPAGKDLTLAYSSGTDGASQQNAVADVGLGPKRDIAPVCGEMRKNLRAAEC
jgi:hypothetical protein